LFDNLILTEVRDRDGNVRHEFRPAPLSKAKGKKPRHVPDPINANPEKSGEELKLLIERIERLEEEKTGISDDISDVYSEAKSRGYDAKIIRTIVGLRKMGNHDRQEMEAILDTYKSALGIV
jgi:uncharacterized protein (UPF0335 family)